MRRITDLELTGTYTYRPEMDRVFPAEERTIQHYFDVVRRRKGTLLAMMCIGLAFGIGLTVLTQPVYRAVTSLELEGSHEETIEIREGSRQPDTQEALQDIKTQIELLKSTALVRRILAALDPEYARGSAPGGMQWLVGASAGKRLTREEAERLAAQSLEVQSPAQTRVVQVSFDATDPKRAAEFLNTLTAVFIQSGMEARSNAGRQTREWLEHKLDDMRATLRKSEDALQQYATQSGLMYIGDRSTIAEEKLRHLQAELSKAHAVRVEKQTRFDLARTASPESLPDVIGDPNLREYQLRLAELKRQQAELSIVYMPEHVRLQRIRAQVQPLEDAFQRERKAVLDRIRNEYDEAAAREALLDREYRSQVDLLGREAHYGVQYGILQREAESNRTLYDALLRRAQEAAVGSALKVANVRVVDPAEPPDLPYKPRLMINLPLGILAALFCGLVLVFVQDCSDMSFQSPVEARRCLDAPELGVVFSAPRRLRDKLQMSVLPASLPLLGNRGGTSDMAELAIIQQRSSSTAASVRAVVASLLLSGVDRRPRVMVITSAGPGEGKTTIASNLSLALAEVGHRVLLIDGDLRRPRLHELFTVQNDCGVATVLESGDNSVVERLTQKTRMPGLYVMPAGPASEAAANLLYSLRLAQLLERLKAQFDTIIIDTPPVVMLPDARLFGRLADGVILVTRAGRTARSAAQLVRQRFADDAIRVLGFVLNDWDPRVARYTYGPYVSSYDSRQPYPSSAKRAYASS